MRIEVRRLNALKKYTGGFEFGYEPAADACLVPLCRIDGKVSVTGNYEIYEDDSVGVNFKVIYRIVGQCSYCLNEASATVEKEFNVLFVTENDNENYSYDGITVNLKTAVDDAILFSQPNLVLCRQDCAGIDVNNK